MLWASWSAGQTFAQSTSHSWIYLVINSVSQAANQAVRPDDSFMHSIHRLVSDLNQPEDWNSVDTDADGLVLGGLGQAQSPPGAAGCQLTSWYFYPPLAGPEPSPIELGQATIEILYPLSVFGLQKKKKKKGEIAKGGSGTFHKHCLCSIEFYWPSCSCQIVQWSLCAFERRKAKYKWNRE